MKHFQPLVINFRVVGVFLSSISLLSCSCYSESSGGYGSTSNAFIFSLRNKERLGPFKSMVMNPSSAIHKGSCCGPTFGEGHDIFIADNANSNTDSVSSFGKSYSVPSGVQVGSAILAGTDKFTPDEVEVFYLSLD